MDCHLLLQFVPVYVYVSEKAVAPHFSTLAWKIPRMEEPGRLQSMGSLRVGHGLLKNRSSDVWVVCIIHCDITAAFSLASGHLEFEIKILYYCTVYSAVELSP